MQKLLIAYLALLFFPLVGEVKLIENGKIA